VVSDFKKGVGAPSARTWFIMVLLACDLAIWRSVSLPVMSAALNSTSRFIILSMITGNCIPFLGSQLLVQPTTGLKRAANAAANAWTAFRAVWFCGLLCEGEQVRMGYQQLVVKGGRGGEKAGWEVRREHVNVHGKLIYKWEAQKPDVVSDARARFERDLAGCG
jgi:hypothetical protein